MLTLTATVRDYLLYLHHAVRVSTLFAIGFGTNVTDASAVAEVNGATALRPVGDDWGLYLEDISCDGATAGLCTATFQLSNGDAHALYLPSAPQPIELGLLVQSRPRFVIANGDASGTIFVTIHALSLSRFDHDMLLKALSPQVVAPMERVQEPIV